MDAAGQIHDKAIGTDGHEITRAKESQETLTSPGSEQSAAKEQLVR
jgi:hypothetical protein